jgi:hypothetical protein
MPIAVADLPKARNVFAHFNIGIVGLNPSSHVWDSSFFPICVVLRWYRFFPRADLPSKEYYQLTKILIIRWILIENMVEGLIRQGNAKKK